MNDHDWFGIICALLTLFVGFHLTVNTNDILCNYLIGPVFLGLGSTGLYIEWEQIR
ncbi:hypothetical protein LCGC14_0752350 [marine sediment metagenome]|uniref:Uncharacterized protein n=1 Tax=marine sediment metagenome TaxID=412755 RepID=A0A0F9Q3J5_9ZZZZ